MVLKIGLLLCWSIVWLKFVKQLLCSELEQTVTCDKAIYIVFKVSKFQYARVEMVAVQTTVLYSKNI